MSDREDMVALADRLEKFQHVLESARQADNKTISVWSDDPRIVAEAVNALRSTARTGPEGEDLIDISVSAEDAKAGSPKPGDMIARNPKNHDDKWLIAAAYFADNFAALSAQPQPEAVEACALAHITLEDDGPYIEVEVLDGTNLQPSMSPVALYTAPPLAPDARMRRALEDLATQFDIKASMYVPGLQANKNNPYARRIQQEFLQAASQIRAALSRAHDGKESEGGKTHVVTLEDQTCDRCKGTGIVSTTKCPQCLGEGSYETSVMAKCVHPSDLTQREAWPNGCRNPNSCSIHRDCMYVGCTNYDRDISGEVDAAIKREGQ